MNASEGVAFFDIYDIKTDCLHPKLLNSISGLKLGLPSNTMGHEGQFSPDGRTYWTTGFDGGMLTALDVSNPRVPRVVYLGGAGIINHGFSFNADGTRLYLATVEPEGLSILDVSAVQHRAPLPTVRSISTLGWTDGATGQQTLPFTWNGRRFLVFVDEGGSGAARIIDITDERHPRIVSHLRLQIQLPQYAQVRQRDLAGTGSFGYEGHYCSVDRLSDPTRLACGYFQSGVRVFDVRNPLAPREIAYFNPPAQEGRKAQLSGSEHANDQLGMVTLTADWCSSPPRFVKAQLWVACQDNGFMVLQFTDHAASGV